MTLIYFSDPGHKRLIPDGCREGLYQPTRTVGWEYQALELNQIKDIKISWKKLSAIYSIGHRCHYFEVGE